jgi:group I intron endonuclease
MTSGVYVITNSINGKQYVGSASDIGNRFCAHLRQLRNGNHHNQKLLRAWRKYGNDAFIFEKLLICGIDKLTFYEQRAIDVLNPEYNICRIAGSVIGIKRRPFSDQHKERLSIARRRRAKEFRTEEQKKKMSLSAIKSWSSGNRKTPKPCSEERKNRISLALKGNTNGRFTRGIPKPPVTDKTRMKLSLATRTSWQKRKNKAGAND